MTADIACVACMVDPQTTSMVVPIAQATLIAVPIFFRGRIMSVVRRALGRDGDADGLEESSSSLGSEGCDTPADDRADRTQPPGAVRP